MLCTSIMPRLFAPQPLRQRPQKFGFAVLFPECYGDRVASYEEFFFSHMTLIEGHVSRLRGRVLDLLSGAGTRRLRASDDGSHRRTGPTGATTTSIGTGLAEAVFDLETSVDDLYYAVRLSEHLWLNSIRCSTEKQHRKFAGEFVSDLASFVDKYDTHKSNLLVWRNYGNRDTDDNGQL